LNFPWIISNLFDKNLGKPVCEAEEHKIFVFNNIKIGIMGLVE
jgi:hypothetical protein